MPQAGPLIWLGLIIMFIIVYIFFFGIMYYIEVKEKAWSEEEKGRLEINWKW